MNRKNGSYGSLDLNALRERLQGKSGRRYWRTLEELADSPDFRRYLDDEFPERSPEWLNPLNRRDVLRLMGASFALAGLTACTRQPPEKIIPYVHQPEEVTLGKPMFYATAMPMDGYGMGVLVESHLGRPTKVEGNPQHPASLGATDVFTQASIRDMWDPDRSRVVLRDGRISAYSRFLGEAGNLRTRFLATKGAGFAILTEPVTSPSVASVIKELQTAYPAMQWHRWCASAAGGAFKGAQMAFGAPVNVMYAFDKAAVVVSLAADFLCMGPGSVRYARDFASARRVRKPGDSMNRLYVIEPDFTGTGGAADHRIPMRQVDIEDFAHALAAQVGAGGGASAPSGDIAAAVSAIAKDLQAHRGASIVIAGDEQPPAVHALAHAMNQALGNAGQTVMFTDPVEVNPVDAVDSLWSLVKAMNAGQVETLVITGSNPVYDAPADMGFPDALKKVRNTVRLGLYEDETSMQCRWHIPQAHYLEAWSDIRAFDGTITIMQPLIAPLYGGRTTAEMLAAFTDNPDRSSYDLVQNYWRTQFPAATFDQSWRAAVHDGIVPNSTLPVRGAAGRAAAAPPATQSQQKQGYELVIRPDSTVYDGRFSNNAWLQELPKTHTKLTWDNAAVMSPDTAQRLGVASEDVVELTYMGRKTRAPVSVNPGFANDSIVLHLGYGRRRSGTIGTGIGVDAYQFRTSAQPGGGAGLQVQKTGDSYPLASTSEHYPLHDRHFENRQIVRSQRLDQFNSDPEFVRKEDETPPKSLSLYPEFDYARQSYAWAMSVDQTACVGCNACVIACVAENNIPVVGKDQVKRGRAMHWLRIDTYHSGDYRAPKTYYQPMMCQHCETAPCEVVCPVAATVHSSEGLNEMVYNRCVGTRYCSNNCPYKVRRFNFYLYSDWYSQSLFGMRNPEVSVRSRGVMEKCTYCVQRIQNAKIDAEREDRLVRDGEIMTACQQACPTEAIVFGNINDKNSRVAKLRAQPISYGVLGDLNTRPRTSYMERFFNTNGELEKDTPEIPPRPEDAGRKV